MIRENQCPKCGATERIPNVRIVDYTHQSIQKRSLTVEIYDHPERLLFKGTHQGALQATICGRCGYAELYLENPQKLLDAYRDRSKL